jgi:hypothetical protein
MEPWTDVTSVILREYMEGHTRDGIQATGGE